MIPTKIKATVEGDLGGQSVAMTIRAEDMAHIMGVVTDLYSDKMLAILREYSTNALDAHKDSGTTRPIEVTLPGGLSNVLTIQDFGTGMSVADLTETYGMFGMSTKRESNEFNGCLGLGSKSALTYGSTFTVSSVKDGVRSEVVVYRDQTGVGRLDVVDTRATDEPNGTTIKIPTTTGDDFTETADKFFYVWDKGTVLVNGRQPKHISDETDLIKLGQSYIEVQKNRYSYNDTSKIHVVMGGVTYTHPMTRPKELAASIEVHAFVGLGDVSFVPSREALQLDRQTEALVSQVWADVSKALVDHFSTAVGKAPNMREAVKAYSLANVILSNYADVYYKGVKMESQLNTPGARQWSTGSSYRRGSAINGTTSKLEGVSLQAAYRDTVAFIKNRQSQSTLAGPEKARLVKYLDDQSLAYDSVYFLVDLTNPLLSDVNTIDWTDVLAKTKVAAQGGSFKVPAGVWDHYYLDSTAWQGVGSKHGTLPDDATLVLYISRKELTANWRSININAVVKALPAKTVVVEVGLNRQAKFERDNKGAQHLFKYIRAQRDLVAGSVSPLELETYRALDNSMVYEKFSGRTKDSHIDLIHDTMDSVRDKFANVETLMNACYLGSLNIKSVPDYIGTKYPLAQTRLLDESVEYINFIHGK